MWPIINPLTLFGDTVGAVAGWAWDKVIQGMYTWFANGLLLMMEWVWRVLSTATTPHLTDDWFRNGLVRPLATISLGIVVALMLASAVQAGFGGRPELVVDALKEGPKAIVASAVTVVVMDVMIRGADVISDVVWQAGQADTKRVLDAVSLVIAGTGGLAVTVMGPLALLFGMVGLLMISVVLLMRSAMLYLVAGFAPIVWASSVSPVLRGSGRRLVHLTVALVLAKPAITITLVIGVKLLANTGSPGTSTSTDAAAALGTLVTGFACFAIAGLSPWVVFRLLPSVEGAAAASGVVGGWGRSAMTAVNAGMMVKSIGATAAASAATKALPQQRVTGTTAAASNSPAGGNSDTTPGQPGSPRSGGSSPANSPTRQPSPNDSGQNSPSNRPTSSTDSTASSAGGQ